MGYITLIVLLTSVESTHGEEFGFRFLVRKSLRAQQRSIPQTTDTSTRSVTMRFTALTAVCKHGFLTVISLLSMGITKENRGPCS